MHKKVINIVHFHRHPHKVAFSIERIFTEVRRHLPLYIHCDVAVSRFPNYGLWRRLYNIIEASFRQKEINHLTGDVNILSYLLHKKRTVLTICDCGSFIHDHSWRKHFHRFFFWILPIKRCAYFTTISKKTKSEVLSYLHCNPSRVRVIYVPISDDFIPIPFIFNEKKPRILQIRTWENKNLVRVAAALKGIPCHLRIIGELSPEQTAVLEQNGIEYSNAFGISNQEMVDEYVKCDMVVFASTYEGFGMPIIEANAVGRPVVTSNIPPMTEVAGTAARLVNPFDVDDIHAGIIQIIEDKRLRKIIVDNGFENVKRFSPTVIAQQYADLYEEMMLDLLTRS